MTSNRIYKRRKTPFQAFQYLQQAVFKELDANISIIFINMIAKYYIGDVCLLSSGETGQIIHINSSDVSRPIIKVDNAFIDLSKESNIYIEEMI
jgi:HD-GYP domain-containing protein (c-di-GMP phosphodiesterase class II)